MPKRPRLTLSPPHPRARPFQSSKLNFRQNPTFEDCFPGSEKVFKEVEHDGSILRVSFGERVEEKKGGLAVMASGAARGALGRATPDALPFCTGCTPKDPRRPLVVIGSDGGVCPRRGAPHGEPPAPPPTAFAISRATGGCEIAALASHPRTCRPRGTPQADDQASHQSPVGV